MQWKEGQGLLILLRCICGSLKIVGLSSQEIQSICSNLMLNHPPTLPKPSEPYPKHDGINLKNPTSDTSCNSLYGYRLARRCQRDGRKPLQKSFSTDTNNSR